MSDTLEINFPHELMRAVRCSQQPGDAPVKVLSEYIIQNVIEHIHGLPDNEVKPGPEDFQFIIYFQESSFSVFVRNSFTIAMIKKIIFAIKDIPTERQQLSKSGKLLLDVETLEKVGIIRGTEVHELILREIKVDGDL